MLMVYLYGVSMKLAPLLIFTTLFTLASVSSLFRKNEDGSTYFLSQDNYALIYEYEIKDSQLVFHYYNDRKATVFILIKI